VTFRPGCSQVVASPLPTLLLGDRRQPRLCESWPTPQQRIDRLPVIALGAGLGVGGSIDVFPIKLGNRSERGGCAGDRIL
jgi:hypothetical protein